MGRPHRRPERLRSEGGTEGAVHDAVMRSITIRTSSRRRRRRRATAPSRAGDLAYPAVHGPSHLHRTPAGRLARRPAGRRAGHPGRRASRRSSAPTTCWRWVSGSGLPGPSDSFVNLAAIAAPGAGHPARHPGHLGHLPAPVDDWPSPSPSIDDISGGRMELGIGSRAGSRPSTRAYGLDFGGVLRRAVRPADRATGDHHRAVGDADRRDASTTPATHYTLAGAPGLPKPVQTDAHRHPAVPIIIGGHGPKPNPGAGRPVRRRVQRRLLRLRGQHHPARPGPGRLRGRRPGSRLAGLLGRAPWSASARTRPSSRRRAAAIGRDRRRRCGQSPFAGTVGEVVDTMGSWAAGRRRSGATCRCWTWPTSSTSRWSAREVLPAVRDA